MPPLRFTIDIKLSLFRLARFHFGLGAAGVAAAEPVGAGAPLSFSAYKCVLPAGVNLFLSSIKPWAFKLLRASGLMCAGLWVFLLDLRRRASSALASALMPAVGAGGLSLAATSSPSCHWRPWASVPVNAGLFAAAVGVLSGVGAGAAAGAAFSVCFL